MYFIFGFISFKSVILAPRNRTKLPRNRTSLHALNAKYMYFHYSEYAAPKVAFMKRVFFGER